jgi:hypothetical protein
MPRFLAALGFPADPDGSDNLDCGGDKDDSRGSGASVINRDCAFVPSIDLDSCRNRSPAIFVLAALSHLSRPVHLEFRFLGIKASFPRDSPSREIGQGGLTAAIVSDLNLIAPHRDVIQLGPMGLRR